MAKKAAAKKAAKKKATNKSAAAPAKNAAIKKVVRKATPVDVEPVSKSEEALLALAGTDGIQPFEDPMGKSTIDLERDTIELAKVRSENEVELSWHLYAIEENALFTDHGYEKNQYYDKILHISPQKAGQMAKNVRTLIEVDPSCIRKMVGCSWGKVKQLRRLIDKNLITNSDELDKWLQKCTEGGNSALTITDLQQEVKDLIASKAKDDLDPTLVPIKFHVPAYERETINDFLKIAQEELKTDNVGSAWVHAAAEWSLVHADVTDATKNRHLGLSNIKTLADRSAPVHTVFFPTSDKVDPNTLGGIIPVLAVYQGYVEIDGKEDLAFCLAPNEKSAKRNLGVKEVRRYPIRISEELQSAHVFQAPEDTEMKIDIVEETKEKKNKSLDEVIATPEPEVEEFVDDEPTMTVTEVKAAIKSLYHELKIDTVTYTAEKKRIRKEMEAAGVTDSGVEHRQIYAWLCRLKKEKE